jgi:hypothetical protein
LREIANAVEATEILSPAIASRLCELHDLTRWIPVSERMPTEDDGIIRCIDGEYAESEFTAKFEKGVLKRWTIGDFDNMGWYRVETYEFTHWQRITPPEGV